MASSTRKRRSNASAAFDTPSKSQTVTPSRRSSRIKAESATPKAVKVTDKKSGYFGESGDVSETEASAADAEESGYEDEEASATEPEPSSEDEYNSSDDGTSGKRKRTSKAKSVPNKATKLTKVKAPAGGGQLWREGVKVDLEPGQEVFVELPKARPAGKTPYRDHTIHPNTILFLADLKANNERIWLKTHDADFRQAENDYKSFVEAMSEKLMEVDETIPELPVKDIIFRIYRDVRFSPDPTPYKPHFSVAWSRTGRKGPFAGYYLQIGSKGDNFLGGGLWMPPADQLALLRRAIDRKPHKMKSVLMKDGIRNSFLGGVSKDEKKVVKAFCHENRTNALKKKPKDYDADHRNIDLLKLKSFTVGRKLKEHDVTAKNFANILTDLMKDMEPWVTYLNSIVMPDQDSSGSEDESNDSEDDDNDDDGEEEDSVDVEDEDPGPEPDEPEDWEPQ